MISVRNLDSWTQVNIVNISDHMEATFTRVVSINGWILSPKVVWSHIFRVCISFLTPSIASKSCWSIYPEFWLIYWVIDVSLSGEPPLIPPSTLVWNNFHTAYELREYLDQNNTYIYIYIDSLLLCQMKCWNH